MNCGSCGCRAARRNFVPKPVSHTVEVCPDCKKKIRLINAMRLVWLQGIYWTRMVMISIAEGLPDQEDAENRLLRNPTDLTTVFASFYSPELLILIPQLLTEHQQIDAALVTALRDGNIAEANELNGQWYDNADRLSDAFADLNPYYNREEIRRMLYAHLDLTKQQTAMRLAGNFPGDIIAFEQIEQKILTLADLLSDGIIRQFPDQFA